MFDDSDIRVGLQEKLPLLRADEHFRAFPPDTDFAPRGMVGDRGASLSGAWLNHVMHAPQFQRLEAAWRSLFYLSCHTETVKIRVLQVSRKELLRDIQRAPEFSDIHLFQKAYRQLTEYRGEPFAVLVGDYEFGNNPEDLWILESLTQVAAAVQAPFLAGAALDLIGPSFQPTGAEGANPALAQTKNDRWKIFRTDEDACYVGLTAPRVLMRAPYSAGLNPAAGFDFEEGAVYLWGNAAFVLTASIMMAFDRYKWCAQIVGPFRTSDNLPKYFQYGDAGLQCRGSAEMALDDASRTALRELGFIALGQDRSTDYPVYFDAAPSCHRAREATESRLLAADLRYVPELSRFMHYMAAWMRDKTASFASREQWEVVLNRWISQYVAARGPADAQRPLTSAHAQLLDRPNRPGVRQVVLRANPGFQLQELPFAPQAVMETPFPPL